MVFGGMNPQGLFGTHAPPAKVGRIGENLIIQDLPNIKPSMM
jgi:hypothetical protein